MASLLANFFNSDSPYLTIDPARLCGQLACHFCEITNISKFIPEDYYVASLLAIFSGFSYMASLLANFAGFPYMASLLANFSSH